MIAVVADASSLFGTQKQCRSRQHFWLLQQCSVVIKAAKQVSVFFTWSKLILTPIRDGLFAGVLWWLMYLHCLALNNKWGRVAFLAAPASAQSQQELVNVVKYFLLVLNSCLHQSGEVYLQDDCCGGWCIFIAWHSKTMQEGSIFGCSSQCIQL